MVKKEKVPSAYKPKVGDKIICEHKGLKYEAKIINDRVNTESQEKQFFIHYQGWSKTWDEWVGETRIFQYNEANIALMKEQRVSQSRSKGVGAIKKRAPIATSGPSPTGGPAISQQNQSVSSTISSQGSVSESLFEPEGPPQLDKEVKIKIPNEVKNWLIDDDNQIKNKKLSNLPARVPIAQILKDFVNSRGQNSKTAEDNKVVLNELTLGVKHYFNVMLGAQLLYKFERLQYQNLLKKYGKDVDLTAHYGVIHLARLFTKIGRPLAATSLDSQSIQTLVSYIHDLLNYIANQKCQRNPKDQKDSRDLFDLDKNYIIAPPDYIKNALK